MAGPGNSGAIVSARGGKGLAALEDGAFQLRITQGDHSVRRRVVEDVEEVFALQLGRCGDPGGVPFAPGTEKASFEESDEVDVLFEEWGKLLNVALDDVAIRILKCRIVTTRADMAV